MGTAKRERQKANKALRDQELARAAAKSRTTRLAILIGAAIVAVFALVFIAGQFTGDDDEPADTVVPAVGDDPVPSGDVEAGAPADSETQPAPVVAEPDRGTDSATGTAADES